MKKLIVALICIPLLVSGLAGFAMGSNQPPEVVTEVITIPEYIQVEKIIEVEKPIYIPIEIEAPIEVVKYRNIFPRQFESVEQFKEWYEAQGFNPLFPSGDWTVDCDDYARWLQRAALEHGYSISQALVLNGKYYGIRISGDRGGHAGNLVLIGNTYYYIEPEPKNFDVIKICERD